MPIRFRCAYCNQLMGIARRKAGTVVSCPTCQGQVVVPSPEPGMVEPIPLPPASGHEPGGGNVFERQDFDPGLFNPGPVPLTAPNPGPAFSQPMMAPAQPLKPVQESSEPFVLPEPADSRPGGMVLTPGKLTILLVGAGVAALILFGIGVLVGKAL
jgi:hypothetical protein